MKTCSVLSAAACVLASLVWTPTALCGQINVFFGDPDGFGYSMAEVPLLDDAAGDPADQNSNGILDEGDSLPNLDGDSTINPDGGDHFDNSDPTDPAVTDIGMLQDTDLEMTLNFQVPAGEQVSSAVLFLVVGDASLINKDFHKVFVDGIDTGSVLEPREQGASGDGLITVTEIALSTAILDQLADGVADVSVAFVSKPDDIAVDYVQLCIETEPAPWTDLGGGTVGVGGVPSLTGTGTLVGGTPASVALSNAPDNATMLAWISFAPVPFAALGGTVHAFPFASQLPLFADASGEFSASTTWPAGIPSATCVWFQFLVEDASSVHGITLSNGLKATTP